MAQKYAVIETKTIYHEGDERSRTHPGHGYPAYDEQVESLRKFESLDKLKQYLGMASNRGRNLTVIKYEELTVTTEVVINVKEQ